MSDSRPARFLQIHALTSYPAALLNRDDAGFAKRLPFGGSVRTRISSQCLKRHWRTDDGEYSLARTPSEEGDAMPMTVRSRRTFESEIFKPLITEDKVDEQLAHDVTQAIRSAVLQTSSAAKKQKAKSEEEQKENLRKALHTNQVLVFGRPEVEFFLKIARQILRNAEASDAKSMTKAVQKAVEATFSKGTGAKNLQSMAATAGLDAALFGRMVTSDVLARCDAAVHVAHAFTVHDGNFESDYFSAVDDLSQAEGETGSGHINSTELTSGLFYTYVVVDVPLLVSNLTGVRQSEWQTADRELAGRVVDRLVRLIATVSPGAKLGSTAPHAYASMLMIEAGQQAPRSLANAFLQPVPNRDVLSHAYQALSQHLAELDTAYGAPAGREALILGPKEHLAEHIDASSSLDTLARWAASQVA